MKIPETIKQFARFVVIGFMNTFVDLFVINVETIITGMKDGLAFSIQKAFSFSVAVTFSYFFNKHWTFKDNTQEHDGRKFSQFISVSLVGLIINVSVSTLAITFLKEPVNNLLQMDFLTDQVWVTLGSMCGTAIGLFWNFIGYKLWVFKK